MIINKFDFVRRIEIFKGIILNLIDFKINWKKLKILIVNSFNCFKKARMEEVIFKHIPAWTYSFAKA